MEYMKISAGFYAKGKTSPGITRENWTFGNKPVPFSRLMASLVLKALEFYLSAIDISVEEINAEIKTLSESIANLKVE